MRTDMKPAVANARRRGAHTALSPGDTAAMASSAGARTPRGAPLDVAPLRVGGGRLRAGVHARLGLRKQLRIEQVRRVDRQAGLAEQHKALVQRVAQRRLQQPALRLDLRTRARSLWATAAPTLTMRGCSLSSCV